mmetsp:Transcript_28680/g.39444  ORF Transcript_28680/g.39444 Transcript_28680/m.39444 type:complete len:219 (-) Transcript_28680:77-733(-)
MFSMTEKNWRDVYKGYNIGHLLTPSGEAVVTFDDMEDAGCYCAIREIDYLLKCRSIHIDALEQQGAARSLLRNMIKTSPYCRLYQNASIRKASDNSTIVHQFGSVFHGHLSNPTYAIIMKGNVNVQPDHLVEVLEKVDLFKNYISDAHLYNFSSDLGRYKTSSPLMLFSNVHHVIPCLMGRHFPETLVEECVVKGIIPVFPSGARFVAKGLEILKKIV